MYFTFLKLYLIIPVAIFKLIYLGCIFAFVQFKVIIVIRYYMLIPGHYLPSEFGEYFFYNV